jgi:hypothetical protein
VIRDPGARGRALAELYRDIGPRLFHDLEESGLLPAEPEAAERAHAEWECFALYACVRGLVAAGGFNRETAAAIDALHERVLEHWMAEQPSVDAFGRRRVLLSERYAEYGEIGQQGGASGAATVARRLGEAAARHMAGPHPPAEGLSDMVGELHEAFAEGAAEAVRSAMDGAPEDAR